MAGLSVLNIWGVLGPAPPLQCRLSANLMRQAPRATSFLRYFRSAEPIVVIPPLNR